MATQINQPLNNRNTKGALSAAFAYNARDFDGGQAEIAHASIISTGSQANSRIAFSSGQALNNDNSNSPLSERNTQKKEQKRENDTRFMAMFRTTVQNLREEQARVLTRAQKVIASYRQDLSALEQEREEKRRKCRELEEQSQALKEEEETLQAELAEQAIIAEEAEQNAEQANDVAALCDTNLSACAAAVAEDMKDQGIALTPLAIKTFAIDKAEAANENLIAAQEDAAATQARLEEIQAASAQAQTDLIATQQEEQALDAAIEQTEQRLQDAENKTEIAEAQFNDIADKLESGEITAEEAEIRKREIEEFLKNNGLAANDPEYDTASNKTSIASTLNDNGINSMSMQDSFKTAATGAPATNTDISPELQQDRNPVVPAAASAPAMGAMA